MPVFSNKKPVLESECTRSGYSVSGNCFLRLVPRAKTLAPPKRRSHCVPKAPSLCLARDPNRSGVELLQGKNHRECIRNSLRYPVLQYKRFFLFYKRTVENTAPKRDYELAYMRHVIQTMTRSRADRERMFANRAKRGDGSMLASYKMRPDSGRTDQIGPWFCI